MNTWRWCIIPAPTSTGSMCTHARKGERTGCSAEYLPHSSWILTLQTFSFYLLSGLGSVLMCTRDLCSCALGWFVVSPLVWFLLPYSLYCAKWFLFLWGGKTLAFKNQHFQGKRTEEECVSDHPNPISASCFLDYHWLTSGCQTPRHDDVSFPCMTSSSYLL